MWTEIVHDNVYRPTLHCLPVPCLVAHAVLFDLKRHTSGGLCLHEIHYYRNVLLSIIFNTVLCWTEVC